MPKSRPSVLLAVLLPTSILCGCSTTTYNPDLPTGAAAYDTIPAIVPAPTTYAIRAKDVLTLRVFGEPEVSQDELRVDDAGLIQVPLIGTVKAAGRDAQEIGSEITGKLAQSYLRNPQVAVSVKQATPSFVSVEGEVEKPGVYEIDGRSTLLSAIARAESPTASAKLTEVVVFRTIDQKSMVARFDLKRIRTGIDPDPMILDGDVVMVGYSTTRGFWQDLLKTAPLLNAFSLAATR